MTIFGTILDRKLGISVPSVVAPPAPDTFLTAVQSLDPVGIWRLSDISTTAFSDLVGSAPGSWVTGTPKPQRTTLVDLDSDGYSIDLTAPCRGSIPHHASHITANGGIFLVCQLRDVVTKQQIINRYEGANTAGRWLIEHTGNGQITGKMTTDSGTVEVSTATGVVTKGVPFGVALTWGTLGLNLYVNSGTPGDSDVTTQGAAGDRPTSIGAWYSGSSPASGLFGWAVLFGTATSHSDVGDLMAMVKATGITRANDVAFNAVAGQTVGNINVLANDDYSGSPAITITAQGSLGTYAVEVDNELTYQAGATGGIDTAGRYKVNGSNEAVLTATVTPTAPFFPTTDPIYQLRASDPYLPHTSNARLSEGVDDVNGYPCTIHQITTAQIVDPMGQRIAKPAGEAVLMRWRFMLAPGYDDICQPNENKVNGSNGSKTIGISDEEGADGGDGPSTQQGYGCRVLFARGTATSGPWDFRVYSYHQGRTNGNFGYTFQSGFDLAIGVWYEIGLQIVRNQGDTANGHLRLWINRQLVIERTNLLWFPFATGNNGSPGSDPNHIQVTNMFGGDYEIMPPGKNGRWFFRDWQWWTGSRANAHIYLASS